MKEALKLALEALEKIRDADTAGATPKQITEVRKLYEPTITAIKEALAQPAPSPEWMTEEEQTAYTFGWFKALEQKRLEQPKEPEQEPVAKAMTAHRAAYFMERFKHEEKLLGPNEQAALDFVISMLEAQPAVTEQHKQEPVAWVTQGGKGWLRWHKSYDDNKDSVPLYTTPPQRTWVGLTDEEINKVLGGDIHDEPNGLLEFVRAIEAKLKGKNT